VKYLAIIMLFVSVYAHSGTLIQGSRDGDVTAIPDNFASADSVVVATGSGLKFQRNRFIQHDCTEKIEFCFKDTCVDDEAGNKWLPAGASNFAFDGMLGGDQIRARSKGAAATGCEVEAGGW